MTDEHLTTQLALYQITAAGPAFQYTKLEEDLDRTKLDNNDFRLAIYENQHQFRTKNWPALK